MESKEDSSRNTTTVKEPHRYNRYRTEWTEFKPNGEEDMVYYKCDAIYEGEMEPYTDESEINESITWSEKIQKEKKSF